jgi:uncharacterized protein YukE
MDRCLLGREEDAVPGPLRVTPEDLLVSAATVDAHADGVWQRHGAADGRIDAAQVGVPAASAAALAATVAKWQTDSAALFGRMVDHAQSLTSGAAAYQQTDAHNATDLNQTGDQVTDLDLGL